MRPKYPWRRRAVLALPAVAALCALPTAGAGAEHVQGWLQYGNDSTRTSSTSSRLNVRAPLRRDWTVRLPGRFTAQLLATTNRHSTTLYAATTAGRVAAIDARGRIAWHADLGRATQPCPQLDSWGVTGTPVIDPDARALYVADGRGRLHALDLGTGRERQGWPVSLYDDPQAELVWGALARVGGAVYAATASYCDEPMEAKLIRVAPATRDVNRWVVVPRGLGGGGGIWGWGGVAARTGGRSLLVVTGNAFRGGLNTGPGYSESAGYGERLVELSPDLEVRAASHPSGIAGSGDLDFAGSPVVGSTAQCGEVVAAVNKNGFAYLWRAGEIGHGPTGAARVSAADSATRPLLSQLAYAPREHAFFVPTYSRLVRLNVTKDCALRIGWSRRTGAGALNSSPTVAGSMVVFVRNGEPSRLLGFDARSGRLRFEKRLDADVLAAPTILGGRIYLASFSGRVSSFTFRR